MCTHANRHSSGNAQSGTTGLAQSPSDVVAKNAIELLKGLCGNASSRPSGNGPERRRRESCERPTAWRARPPAPSPPSTVDVAAPASVANAFARRPRRGRGRLPRHDDRHVSPGTARTSHLCRALPRRPCGRRRPRPAPTPQPLRRQRCTPHQSHQPRRYRCQSEAETEAETRVRTANVGAEHAIREPA